jgi:hypothetical protein
MTCAPFSTDCGSVTSYWQARLSLLRLWLRLYNLTDPTSESWETSEHVLLELRRLIVNLLMSFEHARSIKLGSVKRVFAHAMLMVWGALTVYLNILPDSYGTTPDIKIWLLAKVNDAWLGRAIMTSEDLDIAAELFVGGPLRGMYVEERHRKP